MNILFEKYKEDVIMNHFTLTQFFIYQANLNHKDIWFSCYAYAYVVSIYNLSINNITNCHSSFNFVTIK